MVDSFNKCVFLDRDGVIAIPEFRDGRSYAVRRREDFQIYKDAPESLNRLKQAGFFLVVITNQPDVGKGIVDKSEVEAMHQYLLERTPIDDIYVCYHTRDDDCICRKPSPIMLLQAIAKHSLDPAYSHMIGDRDCDIIAGQEARVGTCFIDRGYVSEGSVKADFTGQNLGDCANFILSKAAL